MTRNILIGLALTAVGVALAVACSSSDGGEDAGAGGACKVSGQCTATEKCENGVCVPSDGGIPGGGIGGGGGTGSDGGGTGTGDCANYTCDGCCTPTGDCTGGISDWLCGKNSNDCVDCHALGKTCSQGYCQDVSACNSSNCSGCCTYLGNCVGGSSTGACGISGVACEDCSASSRICTNGYCN